VVGLQNNAAVAMAAWIMMISLKRSDGFLMDTAWRRSPVSNLERPAPDEYCHNFPLTSRSRFHGTSDERPIGTIMFDSNETGIRGSSVIRHTSEAA
jgi:hypothetical protein